MCFNCCDTSTSEDADRPSRTTVPDRVLAQGWLWKMARWSTAWRRNYCVLLDSPPRIEYYASQKAYECKGRAKTMSFDGAKIDGTAVACAASGEAVVRGLHCLEIFTPGRTWRFGSEDPDATASWITAINFAISAHPYREISTIPSRRPTLAPTPPLLDGGHGGNIRKAKQEQELAEVVVDVELKVVTVGSVGTGKTRLASRYVDGNWEADPWSAEVPQFEYLSRVVKCDSRLCRWDTTLRHLDDAFLALIRSTLAKAPALPRK
eukprot:m51a1_g3386 hypothetical protein (264) ;mRNA; f:503473-505004